MSCNFYFVRNHKSANNSTATEATEKICADLETSEFYIFYVCLYKFKNNKTFLNKISYLFFAAAMLNLTDKRQLRFRLNVPLGVAQW